MSGLDVSKLKQAQEELDKRTQGGTKGWINIRKIEDPIDVRIMDPVKEMDGIYYLEVPVWWVNKQKMISPKFFGEDDVIEKAVEQAKIEGDPDVLKLLNAKVDHMKKIDFQYEYWIPVLQFDWKFDPKTDEIKGIYDADGNYDANAIKKFVVDDRVKMLQIGVSLLKAINKLATARGGGLMTDPVKGFNLTLSKSGEGRKTSYGAVKAEEMPIPIEYYENMISPVDILRAQMYTNKYMDSVVGEYLWGERKLEEEYRFPEVKAELEAALKDEDVPKARSRGRGAETATEDEAAPEKEDAAARPTRGRGTTAAAPTRGRGAAKTEEAETAEEAPVRGRGRGAAPAEEEVPKRGRGRNLVDDIAETDE